MPARKPPVPTPDQPTPDRPSVDSSDRPLPASLNTKALARPFLPSIDLVDPSDETLKALTANDKQLILETKVADITHFRVGLSTLHRHARVALELAPTVRILPAQLRGLIRNGDGSPAARVSVEPVLPNQNVSLGRAVITDDVGVFALPLTDISAAHKKIMLASGIGLRIMGDANEVRRAIVAVPPFGRQAVGEIRIDGVLRPLPTSIVGALIDLVEGLPSVTGGNLETDRATDPVRVQLGQDACNIVFEEDAVVRRFPYKLLVRLVEPRTTTVNKVYIPARVRDGAGNAFSRYLVPSWSPNLLAALGQTDTRFVERLPVDKPISVDGFRDQLIGVRNNRIGTERTVPMAGTLGLGYVLNLQQVWKYKGLTLGNLLYSLPLAPGEQQRIAVSERVATAAVRESERLDITERQHSSLREDASTQAVFDSAFEEHVNAGSSYRNSARSSSWGVAGGIGAVLGPVAIGIGAGGGGGKSSNNGSTSSSLDGARSYTSSASEEMHRSVEREAAARRTAQRSSIRLATETDRETVTTKVITNHNKGHALTIQYWEVLRKFASTTEVNGVDLVCFVPLDLVRFLPAGQQLELTNTLEVDTRAELLVRYALLHRHSDAVQSGLPLRHREGLRILGDFAANPRASVNVAAPAANTLAFSLTGRFIPYERLWVRIQLRSGRHLGPVALDSVLTAIPSGQFGTRTELLSELKRLRTDGAEVNMTGSMLIPDSVDPSEIVAFEIDRAFSTIDYQLDPTKNPLYQAMQAIDNLPFVNVDLNTFESSARFTASELEREIGGPFVRNFTARMNGGADSIAADGIGAKRELPPGGYPVSALERNPILGFRDIMKIERTLQHVVQNTLTYSKAVWSSLTQEERVVMLEGYTIGLPEEGLSPDGFTDASQHVPLLNCVANQVLGYYGNCMVLPFSIPAALAVALAGEPDADDAEDREPLTNAAVQEALTLYHKEAFSPPESNFTLPTRGVLGEAVLGHCSAAEKIDLTRFWNWQDSPADAVADIANVGLRANSLASLTAPATLSATPSIINNVAGEGSTAALGALAQALAGKAPAQGDFSDKFLGQDVLTALGGKTIDSAEAARKDALASATSMASQALTAGVDVFKTKFGADKAADEKKVTEAKAATDKAAADAKTETDAAAAAAKAVVDKQAAAEKTLKDNATSYLAVAEAKAGDPAAAIAFAEGVINGLAGSALPTEIASRLFAAFDKKQEGSTTVRTAGSTAWLTALGLL